MKPSDGIHWYDRQGNRLNDYEEIEKLLSDLDYKILKQDQVGPFWCSTVWLGLDHNYFGETGPPQIFETSVFTMQAWEDDRDWNDPDRTPLISIETERYATEAAALAGHWRMVQRLIARLPKDFPIDNNQQEEEN